MDFSPLSALYAGALVRGGRVYPVSIRPHAAVAGGFVRLTPEKPPCDPELLAAGQPHLAEMLSRRRLFDGAIVCWRSTHDRIEAVRGSYFDATATCDALRAEFEAHPSARLTDLPMRQRVHALAGDPLENGAGRAAAIGVSVVCTVPSTSTELTSGQPGQRSVVIGRRHASVVDSGLWHVAPAGNMEEAADGEHLLHTIADELAEELGITLTAAEVGARATVLGICHDLLRLRPDVVVRLDLGPDERPDHRVDGQEFDELRMVPLDALGDVWGQLPPGDITAPGAGALALLERSRRT